MTTQRSITTELHEMERVASRPTVREFRSMTKSGSEFSSSMNNFKIMVGKYVRFFFFGTSEKLNIVTSRRARQRKQAEREQLGFWGRRKDDFLTLLDSANQVARKQLVSVWTRQTRLIEQKFGGGFACYFDFSQSMLLLNVVIVLLVLVFILAEGLVDRDWEQSNVDYIPYFPLNKVWASFV